MKIEEYVEELEKEGRECRKTFATISTIEGMTAAAPSLSVALISLTLARLEQIRQTFEREMAGERVKGEVLETAIERPLSGKSVPYSASGTLVAPPLDGHEPAFHPLSEQEYMTLKEKLAELRA